MKKLSTVIIGLILLCWISYAWAAYTLMGNPAISRGYYTNTERTRIDKLVPAPARGILKEVQIYMRSSSTTFKIKVFRDDGTNYVFIGETPALSLSVGLNTIQCWIPVEKGDLIGWYNNASSELQLVTTGGNSAYQSGDVTATSAKSTWTAYAGLYSVEGKVFSKTPIF